MKIIDEIRENETELECSINDWGIDFTVSFITDLIEKDRTKQLRLRGVSKRTLKRICEHKDCNKEFTLELNLYGDKSKANVAMVNCTHCNKRNDVWIELS